MARHRGSDGDYADLECADAELERYLVLSWSELARYWTKSRSRRNVLAFHITDFSQPLSERGNPGCIGRHAAKNLRPPSGPRFLCDTTHCLHADRKVNLTRESRRELLEGAGIERKSILVEFKEWRSWKHYA